MKISSILVVGFITSMLLLVVVAIFVENLTLLDRSKLIDVVLPTDSININLNLISEDLDAKKSTHLEVNDNYWIDDDGGKHYTINAFDSPNIQE